MFENFCSIGIAEGLTVKTAAVLLPIAHMFDLNGLEDKLSEYISGRLSTSNACQVFDKIHEIQNPVIDKCLDTIIKNIDSMLADGSIMRMEDDALKKILKDSRTLALLKKTATFEPMLVEAREQCVLQSWDVTSTNLRKAINTRLYLIDFTEMRSNDFVECVAKVGKNFFYER